MCKKVPSVHHYKNIPQKAILKSQRNIQILYFSGKFANQLDLRRKILKLKFASNIFKSKLLQKQKETNPPKNKCPTAFDNTFLLPNRRPQKSD